MTTDHKVFDRVRDTLVNNAYCSADQVTLEAKLGDDLALDSLDGIELTIRLEEEFNISLDIEFEESDTVAQVVAAIQKELACV